MTDAQRIEWQRIKQLYLDEIMSKLRNGRDGRSRRSVRPLASHCIAAYEDDKRE